MVCRAGARSVSAGCRPWSPSVPPSIRLRQRVAPRSATTSSEPATSVRVTSPSKARPCPGHGKTRKARATAGAWRLSGGGRLGPARRPARIPAFEREAAFARALFPAAGRHGRDVFVVPTAADEQERGGKGGGVAPWEEGRDGRPAFILSQLRNSGLIEELC